jgi:transcriptional regulatory protein LevR
MKIVTKLVMYGEQPKLLSSMEKKIDVFIRKYEILQIVGQNNTEFKDYRTLKKIFCNSGSGQMLTMMEKRFPRWIK